MSSAHTGIKFVNNVQDSDSANILEYLYFYNGGGVAIGDFNNDRLADIYFVSNQYSNTLYLNKGGFTFQDITARAGVQGSGNWKTGVTLVDINSDGYLDIYVSEVGNYKKFHGKNELFINNGDLTFTEMAKDYGLDVIGFNTQAVFFDFDNDLDLDMFLVNHSIHSNEVYKDTTVRRTHNDASGDKLFQNDTENGSTKFTEVTKSTGIYSSVVGYGLNAIAADINNDGWTDLYVSNDFHENDYYYLNNKDGTFKEINAVAFAHESRFSMGSDIADMNNDGWLDIITLDMLAPDKITANSSAGDDPYDIYQLKHKIGYHYQYSRNSLQINDGTGTRFAEIGLYAGIAATDWSWSPLAADFDNDGIKDLFISNGIVRRPNDLDFLKYNLTSVDRSRKSDDDLIEKMPGGKVTNYIFQGTDSLKFKDQSVAWGFTQSRFTTGAAYADLDNDGDLDIVCNNINDEAGVYRNNTVQQSGANFLELRLQGKFPNPAAVGTTVKVWGRRGLQYGYLTGTRGFESSALQYIHFGAGNDSIFSRVEIKWPGGESQVMLNVAANQILNIQQENASTAESTFKNTDTTTIFTDLSAAVDIPFIHRENGYSDFSDQPFIPHMLSTEGPGLAVGDINADGLDDFFVCGARGQPSALFQQTMSGKFVSTNKKLLAEDAAVEHVNAVFFDADNDSDIDLFVVSGGNERSTQSMIQNDRLYLNDGKGTFHKSEQLPDIPGNKSIVITADVDRDGDEDVFIGGRVVSGRYGEIPSSYLLLNQGKGEFIIADKHSYDGLQSVGMVTDARWVDVDSDGWKDLIMVGEWMPITIFLNKKGLLKNATQLFGLQASTGWWTRLHIADVDNDGREDLLAGNWGTNSKLKASISHPLLMYLFDHDDNGTNEQVLVHWQDTAYYSFLGKEELERNIPSLKKRFLKYRDFAGLTANKLFGEKLMVAKKLQAANLSTTVFLRKGNTFVSVNPLPYQVQLAPVFGMISGDFNNDGKIDFVTGGNFFGVVPYEGSYDASGGNIFLGCGSGKYVVPAHASQNLRIQGEIRDIKKITLTNNRKALLISRNNDKLILLEYKN